MAELRHMTDSTNALDNPSDQKIVAGYVNGMYANVNELRKRYPKATIVTITVDSTADAHVIDCERWDATPSSSARWAKNQKARGAHPTIYTSLSMVPAVISACKAEGLKWHRDYEIWQAHYDGKAELPRGFVAKQYDDKGPRGEHYDRSVVAAYWPGVDPKPKRRRVWHWRGWHWLWLGHRSK